MCETLGPLEMRIDPDRPLEGEIEVGSVGDISVGRVSTAIAHSVHRTAALVRREESPDLHRVVLAVSGSLRVAQDGRVAVLGPGQLAVYDFARPYDLGYDDAVELAVFSFPRGSLALPSDDLARLVAMPIGGTAGTGALASSLLRRVACEHETYPAASAARLSTVMADLVAAALAERMDLLDAMPVEAQERTLLLQVRAFVERHLGDVDLDPATIAGAHHISVRNLHRLFEDQSTTVAAWVRQRRLERCRADLADPACRDRSISDIGARWGLPDPAHFSRLFRRTYGWSPRDYRRDRLAALVPA